MKIQGKLEDVIKENRIEGLAGMVLYKASVVGRVCYTTANIP